MNPLAGSPPARPWLVADIGGTNARFGWVSAEAPTVEAVMTLPTAGHDGPAQAAAVYLERLPSQLGSRYCAPAAAAFAVATALDGDQVALTNNGWNFSRQECQQTLGLSTLLLLNDFEALALSLPGLRPEQLHRGAGGRRADHTGTAVVRASGLLPLAVIGPGTGLGVAGIVPGPMGWVAVPGEGGHATLSAADETEAELLAIVRRWHQHVSAERLLSGIGLPVLHAALLAMQGARTTGAANAADASGAALTAEQVVQRGLSGSDALCTQTLDHFCALLGSFAGNVALTLGARGGVFIGGGIVPRLGERFFASAFRQRFEAKGRFQSYLQAIPTAVITDTLAALGGAALALEQHRS